MVSQLEVLEKLLKKGHLGIPWMIFTGYGYNNSSGFHLTLGMCDDFGCTDTCRNFNSLTDLLKYLYKGEFKNQ